MGAWGAVGVAAAVFYFAVYLGAGRLVPRLALALGGCGAGGSVFLAWGVLMGLASAPGLAYLVFAEPRLLVLRLSGISDAVLLALLVAGVAGAVYVWDSLAAGATPAEHLFAESLACRPAATLAAAYVAAPLCEEAVFRGLVQHGLSGLLGGWAALLVASALFAALHVRSMGARNAPLAAGVSLILGLLLMAYGSLIPPVLAHASANLAGTARLLPALRGASGAPNIARRRHGSRGARPGGLVEVAVPEEARINALFYGLLLALGAMLLKASPSEIRSAQWLGGLLAAYGVLFALFLLLESLAAGAEHQGTINIVLGLVITGSAMMRFGAEAHRILGAVLLSIALSRAAAILAAALIPPGRS